MKKLILTKMQQIIMVISIFLIFLSVGGMAIDPIGEFSAPSIREEGLAKSGDEIVSIPSWEELFPNVSIREIFVEDSEFGVAVVDLRGTFVRVNRALCRILGYTEQELLSLTFMDITHFEDKAFDIASANSLISYPKRKSYFMIKKYLRKNQQPTTCMIEVFIATDLNDKPLYFVTKVIPLQSHVIKTASINGQGKDEDGFIEFLSRNFSWIITSFVAALSFALLIGRNIQRQADFNKSITKALNLDEEEES